jgi:ATP-dependent protease ClpP protease subunit
MPKITGGDSSDGSNHIKIHVEELSAGNIYHVDFATHIESDILGYTDLFNVLRCVHIGDKINFYLNNKGGDVDTTEQIIVEMKNSAAPVHVFVRSNCYSAGAILAVAGTSLTIAPKAYLMFHNYTSSVEEKGLALKDFLRHQDAHYKELLELYCRPFLTNKEIETILSDNDVYIKQSDGDMKDRILRHFTTKRGNKR